MQRFHFSQFADTAELTTRKLASGSRISVCIPTLNEAGTIGNIVGITVSELMEKVPLVDEILVIDSGSNDGTREIAAAAGAKVYLSSEIASQHGTHLGKGENLWKALHVADGDIVCYIDGDISNFTSSFVTGLIGPLLTNPNTDYVKAFYQRPLDRGEITLASAGGRVSEILVRPLLSLFYPELAPLLQPLSGEYAARRSLLETLSFPVGYGVEIAHLIDLAAAGKLEKIAQTDLVKRAHRNRDDGELGSMAFAILRVVLRRLERDGKITIHSPLPDLYQAWLTDGDGVQSVSRRIPEPEREPVSMLQRSHL